MIGMPENQHTPLWKQLLGAATGATVALLLYGGFAVVSPNFSVLTAYLSNTFEGKIEHLPTYQRSPRTVRDETIAFREALGDRARAATARLQKGENYFQGGESSWSALSLSSVAPIPSVTKEKDHGKPRPKEREKEKHADEKRKEEKLPDTGVPLLAIGGVALCLAMSIRYRKELLGAAVPVHTKKWPLLK